MPNEASAEPQQLTNIRAAAHAAKSGNTDDIKRYTQLVAGSFWSPGPITDLVVMRVSNAEASFRQGSRKGITEADLLTHLNALGDKMGLPDYGKTSKLELSLFRVQVCLLLPEVCEQTLTNFDHPIAPDGNLLTEIAHPMSPTEALYITGSLIVQKRCNPQFHLTEAECSERYQQIKLTAGSARQNFTGTYEIGEVKQTERQKKIIDSINSYLKNGGSINHDLGSLLEALAI